MSESFDLSRPRRVHVLNAGGAGMSAIATVLVDMGHDISGADGNETSFVELLRERSVPVLVGDATPLAGDVEAVIVSTATPADHPNVEEAVAKGLPVLTRSDLLGVVTQGEPTIVVSGTHGKTTTAAMLASALTTVGSDPSYLLGAAVAGLDRNASWRDGAIFVVEGDESDGTFLSLTTSVGVVTNVEPDHLEFWRSFDGLIDAFDRFVDGAGQAVVCADDPVAAELGRRHDARSYGTSEQADYRVSDVSHDRLDSRAWLDHPDGRVELHLHGAPGLHNLRNAAATVAGAAAMGLDPDAVAAALSSYRGVARRYESRGEVAGITFVDSYDHLPTEVRSALAAARLGGWQRVVCVFQPHRYSRTQALADEFGSAFDGADLLVLTDVYPAGEPPRPGVDGQLVVDAVNRHDPDRNVTWQGDLDDVVGFLSTELRSGDLCLTLGAGDLTTVPGRVIDRLTNQVGQ